MTNNRSQSRNNDNNTANPTIMSLQTTSTEYKVDPDPHHIGINLQDLNDITVDMNDTTHYLFFNDWQANDDNNNNNTNTNTLSLQHDVVSTPPRRQQLPLPAPFAFPSWRQRSTDSIDTDRDYISSPTHDHTSPTATSPSAKKNKKRKQKRKNRRKRSNDGVCYDPHPECRAQGNIQISKSLTEAIIPNTIKERINNVYTFMDKSVPLSLPSPYSYPTSPSLNQAKTKSKRDIDSAALI